MSDEETICIGCGCTDSDACPGGCSWLRVDQAEAVGICSACERLVAGWDDACKHEAGADREDA